MATSVLARRGGGELPRTRLRLTTGAADRERLTAYQRLTGLAVSDVLPSTWPHVVGFPLQVELMARRTFPLPLPGLVHVENAVVVHRALSSTDELEVTVSARDLRAHPRGRTVDVVTEVDVDGVRVWEGRSTYLARGGTDGALGSAPGGERGGAAPGEEAPELPAGPAAARWHLPRDLGRRYAAVSGDVNPIHLSPVTARALGFPRAIAHGMWTYARTLAALGPAVAGPGTSHVWFRKPVLLPGDVDLVVRAGEGRTIAGLRATGHPATTHLVLTHTPSASAESA